jgi:hypothetical protein
MQPSRSTSRQVLAALLAKRLGVDYNAHVLESILKCGAASGLCGGPGE